MAGVKDTIDRADHAVHVAHVVPPDHPDHHEAVLTGVMALANLFSNCVEAFNLVHPSQRWDKHEQVLIVALGIQQARLLIWGDVVGISSPPASVTDRAVPKHPSAAYPDLKEPTFFGARDPRLDEPAIRQTIDEALSVIVDRSAHTSREEMMEKYGLKPPKRFGVEYQGALDTNRLESFRERYELLQEVAESYAHLNTRRNSSIVSSSWMIHDYEKFANFVKLTQEKIDALIHLMDNKERVDRAMCMDIRALGWHLSADRVRIASDVSKLKLIQEVSKKEYPEYLDAISRALANIERERKENAADYNPYASAAYAPLQTPRLAPPLRSGRGSISTASGATNGATNGADGKEPRRHSLFGSLFKRKSSTNVEKARSLSVADAEPSEPERALSDVGPLPWADQVASEPPTQPGAIRSKSVGDILDAPINTEEEEELRTRLEQMKTNATASTVADEETPEQQPSQKLIPEISRHDQYHGLGRQGTKTQWD